MHSIQGNNRSLPTETKAELRISISIQSLMMGFARVVLRLLLPMIWLLVAASTAEANFRCRAHTTCRSLIGYRATELTYFGGIQSLFNFSDLTDILGVNGLPESTGANDEVEANRIIRIPIDCNCTGYSGWSIKSPIYTINYDDTFFRVATSVFNGLMTYQDIEKFNPQANPVNLSVGEEVYIPLPCSCGMVNGSDSRNLMHYIFALEYGTTLEQVAQEYGTTPDAILSANDLQDPNQIRTSEPLDVPLAACSSAVRDDSLDYPLLLTNGSYMYTANGCVRCKCDSANNWILQCEPTNQKPTNWSACPSTKCNSSSNLHIGNSMPTSSCNRTICAYAGYGHQTIFTTLVTESICPELLPDNSWRFNKDANIDHKIRSWIWFIVVGGVVALPIFCYLCYVICRKCKAKVDRIRKRTMLIQEIGGPPGSSVVYNIAKRYKRDGKAHHEIQIFSFKSIVTATNNFSDINMLGQGGYGLVYKGQLLDGQKIAIKRLSKGSGQGLTEFKNEAKLIAKLQHTSLVRLLGFCVEREERILVYEYMPNKSLDFYLFDSEKRKILNWERRLNIIEGVAQGLVYLHMYSRLKVIHRDLKASNILLDDDMNPKISDFGMARIFDLKGIEENTNRIVGTYGYMSSEYAMNGVVSLKTDVFSFGVLVLEIVSGKKNNSRYHSDHPLNLIGFAWGLWNEGRGAEIIDPSFLESCNIGEVLRCIQVGLLCVQDHAGDRPSMLEVVSMLGNETATLPAPKQPAFYIDVAAHESNRLFEKPKSCSVNEVTISVMDAR